MEARESFHSEHLNTEEGTSLSVCVSEKILEKGPGKGNRSLSRGKGSPYANPRSASRIVASVRAGHDTAKEISEDVGIPISTVHKKLSSLVTVGVLVRRGKARRTSYHLDEGGERR
jgi:hypothetical protein